MELFDSHAHYSDEKFDSDRNLLIYDIYSQGITKFMSAGYNIESSIAGLNLANKYDYIYTTIGISPNDVCESIEETENDILKVEKILIEDIEKCKKNKLRSKIVGIGEIGLDYHWKNDNIEIQKYAFIKQIELANKYKLPIVIHTREAIMDTLEILKNKINVKNKGVFHCCPLNKELVKEGLKLGFYISFAGPITFKNSKNADEIIELVPINQMLIETDSPYLSPEPKRGTRNDSRNLKYIAEKIADVKKISVEEIAQTTYNNALKIFNI